MTALVWFWFVVSAGSAAGKVIIAKPGQRFTLECGSSSNNFKSLSWYRGNNLIISVNGKTGLPSKGTAAIVERSKVRRGSNLEISVVKKEDAGKFSCNIDGNSQEYTLLVVSVWSSLSKEAQLGSEVTLHCEVAGLSSDSLVQWTQPDGRSPTSSGTVHLNHVTHSDAGTWVCVFSSGGETFKESLDIKIKEPASESLTSSPIQSSEVDQKTCNNSLCSSPGGTEQPSSVGLPDWWVWVVVGAGCCVVLLLLVCIIVLCKRSRRRKRNFQRMKNERQSERPRKYCQCNCPTAATKPQQGRQKGKPSALPLKPLLMQ